MAHPVVIKLGTQVVAREDGTLSLGTLGALVEQLAALRADGHAPILVSSGAVGLGAARLGLPRPIVALADRQAAAAVGQGVLLALYDALFSRVGCTTAQVLLTEGDFHQRDNYVALAGAFERLLALGVVPIVNQNDVVSTSEIALRGTVFGDNDRLAALVAANLDARLLVLLSNVDGVYTAPPGTPGAQRIARWRDDIPHTLGANSPLGTGGMGSKIEAARMAARAGVATVIADGRAPDALRRALDADPALGTRFDAAPDALSGRRRWLALATGATGALQINDGAAAALRERGASLLWPGLLDITGEFRAGDVVTVLHAGRPVAKGRVRHDADALRADLQGGRGVVIHRDDLVLDEEEPG